MPHRYRQLTRIVWLCMTGCATQLDTPAPEVSAIQSELEAGSVCLSSQDCRPDEICSTELTGCPVDPETCGPLDLCSSVCAGVCQPNDR